MTQLTRLLTLLPRTGMKLCVTRPVATRQLAQASSSKSKQGSNYSSLRTSSPPLIVFDAPSKPTEHHTRRSARSPHSLSDYYSARRRLAAHSPSHVRSTTSTSIPAFTASPLTSLSDSANPHARTFDSPSKPREYYARPQRKRELPKVGSRLPFVALLAALGLSAWGAFILYATNLERLSSSVVRQLTSNLKSMESVKDTLGDGVKPEGKWWLGGEPWIDGAINLLQGNVDVSFRVRGSKGAGTVYFTSVREAKGQPFRILRSKIICDDGVVLQLLDV